MAVLFPVISFCDCILLGLPLLCADTVGSQLSIVREVQRLVRDACQAESVTILWEIVADVPSDFRKGQSVPGDAKSLLLLHDARQHTDGGAILQMSGVPVCVANVVTPVADPLRISEPVIVGPAALGARTHHGHIRITALCSIGIGFLRLLNPDFCHAVLLLDFPFILEIPGQIIVLAVVYAELASQLQARAHSCRLTGLIHLDYTPCDFHGVPGFLLLDLRGPIPRISSAWSGLGLEGFLVPGALVRIDHIPQTASVRFSRVGVDGHVDYYFFHQSAVRHNCRGFVVSGRTRFSL